MNKLVNFIFIGIMFVLSLATITFGIFSRISFINVITMYDLDCSITLYDSKILEQNRFNGI